MATQLKVENEDNNQSGSKRQELGLSRWRSAVSLPEVLFDTASPPGRGKSWGCQGGGQPSAFLKFFLTTPGGCFGACSLFRLTSVWRTRARGAETGADTVGDQLCSLVDPSGTPLHGCVVCQDEALLAVAPGAAEACQACIRGCLRVLTQRLQR